MSNPFLERDVQEHEAQIEELATGDLCIIAIAEIYKAHVVGDPTDFERGLYNELNRRANDERKPTP